MNKLTDIKCVGCEGGIPPLSKEEIQQLLKEIPKWQVSEDGKWLLRDLTFKNFYHVMGFINALAYLANQENHHPDLSMGYNYCHIKLSTHAVSGLTQNDFILAAKINLLLDPSLK